MKNPKLDEAVAIFKKLGWEAVNEDNILELPLGTAEEKRIALAGLKSGDLGWTDTRYWYSYTDYDSYDNGKLVLFAIVIGIDVKQALMLSRYRNESEVLAEAIASRGQKFVTDFIAGGLRRREDGAMTRAITILIDRFNLELPQNKAYFEQWQYEAFYYEKPSWIALMKRCFKDHILAGMRLTTHITWAVADGVAESWLTREDAIDITLSGIDFAVNSPRKKRHFGEESENYRSDWLDTLDELEVTDAELCAHVGILIPILSAGDPNTTKRLAPALIAGTEDEQLAEVLIAALSTNTKTVKALALQTALAHPHIKNTDDIAPWLVMLADDINKPLAKVAKQLMKQWGIEKGA